MSRAALRLSPRQHPAVSGDKPGSTFQGGVPPSLDLPPSETPQMLRQALPSGAAGQAALSAGQPSWLPHPGCRFPQQCAPYKTGEGDSSNAGRLDSALSQHIIARELHDDGKLEEARQGYLDARDMFQPLFGAEHAYIAICQIGIGVVLSTRGKHEEALDCFRKALAISAKAEGAGMCACSVPPVHGQQAIPPSASA